MAQGVDFMPSQATNLQEAIRQAAGQYFRLVLLVAPSGSGKTAVLQSVAQENGFPLLNVNLELSKRMLELTRTQRSRQVERLLKEVIAADPATWCCWTTWRFCSTRAWRSNRCVCSRCRAATAPSSPRGTAASGMEP